MNIVYGASVRASERLGLGLELLANVEEGGPDATSLLDELVVLGEAAAQVEELEAKAVREVVAHLAAAVDMV